MNTPDERLREAWRERTAAGPVSEGCFDAEQIWRAVALEAPASERRSLVDHVASCAGCAEAWRLASELCERATSRAEPVRPHRAIGLRHRALGLRPLAVAAATLVAVAGLGWFALHRTAEQTTVRAADPGIRSLLEEGGTLPRERFLLRWTAGPPGTIYDVEVATTELKLVTRGLALTTPEFLVPERALADLAPRTSIAWRVEATLPDGRVVTSVTHVNRVP